MKVMELADLFQLSGIIAVRVAGGPFIQFTPGEHGVRADLYDRVVQAWMCGLKSALASAKSCLLMVKSHLRQACRASRLKSDPTARPAPLLWPWYYIMHTHVV